MLIDAQNIDDTMKYYTIISNQSDYDTYYEKYSGCFKENTDWFRYRLGDMFRFSKAANDIRWGFNYHKKEFPNSIATQYLSASNGTDSKNFSLLLNIVKNRSFNIDFKKEYNVSFEDTIIVHLRTGDVIDYDKKSVNQILMNKKNLYYRPMVYYVNILEKLKTYNYLKKVLFITGYHQGNNHTKSIMYIIKIIKLFELNGYKNIKLRVNENPDIDFLIMCNSKYFIRSGGGFSKIITKLVYMKGGNVYPCLSLLTLCVQSHLENKQLCIYCKD